MEIMTERRKLESDQPELSGLTAEHQEKQGQEASQGQWPPRVPACVGWRLMLVTAGHLPLCVAGAKRCTPSSFLTLAPPTGKLENTTVVCQPHNPILTTPYCSGLTERWVRVPGPAHAGCRPLHT